MCLPNCRDYVSKKLSRRAFLSRAAAVTAGAMIPVSARAETAKSFSFSRVVDLTHRITSDFPTFTGKSQLKLEDHNVGPRPPGYHAYHWSIDEHTGTHMDAPIHFGGKFSADQLSVSDLVGPLAVVDIRSRAGRDADARLTPDDLKSWERKHGPLPEGGIVAMWSGWEEHLKTKKFRNADVKGVMHFPGFHEEATDFLLRERRIKGICVDTLSLDYGPAADFPVHCQWLGAGHWGMECVARLDQLPATGAFLIAGGPMIAGCSGGPSRVLALV